MNINKNSFYCKYCLKPFNLYFIRCIECNNIDLCIPCFSYGIQGGTHKRNHLYSIKNSNEESEVFLKSKWSRNEELKLLDAIELYGVGNWNDISLKVESHDPDECRDHYIKYYIDGAIGKYLLGDNIQKTCQVSDHSVNTDNSTLSPSLYEIMPHCILSLDDQVMLGYMPKRDDFERDYDNDAESILCRLKPDFIQDDLLDALKVAHVGIYTQRLKERQRRKLIAREHDLIGPIMSCILNRRWKPTTYTSCSDQTSFNGFPSARQTPGMEIDTDDQLGPRNKPFTILSSNMLATQIGISRRQSHKVSNNDKRTAAAVAASLTNSSTGSVTTAANGRIRSGEMIRNRPYDAFMVNENLKPFLRYLTFSQGKALLENLHREEVLKYEISSIISAMKRGRRKLLDVPLRFPNSSSIFVRTRPRVAGPTFDNGNGSVMVTTAAIASTAAAAEDDEDNDSSSVGTGTGTVAVLGSAEPKKPRRRRKPRPYYFVRKRQR